MKYRKSIAAVILVAILAGAIAWLAGTTSGLRFLVARALPALPISLDTSAIEGRLVGPISLPELELYAPGAGGRIAGITLDWRPTALLRGTLHVVALVVDSPHIELEPAAETSDEAEGEPFPGSFSLPLRVKLDELAIRNGRLRSADALLVDALDVELGGEASRQSLALTRLSIASDQGQVSGHARISLDPAEPWDVDLHWQLLLEDLELAGHSVLAGPLPALALRQELTAPAEARLAGELRGLPQRPEWDLQLELAPLPVRGGPWPELADGAAARLTLAGVLPHSTLAGHLELPGLAPERIDLEAEGGWQEGWATLHRLDLRLASGAKLGGSGRFATDGSHAGQFELDGADLGWPLGESQPDYEAPRIRLQADGLDGRWRIRAEARVRGEPVPELDLETLMEWDGVTLLVERLEAASTAGDLRASAHGALDTSGEQLAYRLYAEVEAELPELPAVQATFEAEGDQDGLRVDTLSARLLDGVLEGAGQIAWRGPESADFVLTFSDIDPRVLAPDWPGRLSGELRLERLPADAQGLDIRLTGLRGELRSLPLAGGAELNVRERATALRQLRLALGTATLEARGSLDETSVELAASLDVPELRHLDERARGSLKADLGLAGPRELPRVELSASGERLRWQTNRLRSFEIEAEVDPSGARSSQVRAEFLGLGTATRPAADIRLDAAGTPANHQARASLERRRPAQDLSLEVRGGLEDSLWTGQLGELVFRDAGQEIWALRAPAALSVHPERVDLEEACMAGTLGLLCLDGNWVRGGPWQGVATLAQLDLEPLSAWLDAGLLASGMVTGVVAVEADAERFRSLAGGIALTDGALRLAGDDAEPLISWDGGALSLEGDASAARMSLRLAFPGEDQLEGALSIGWNEDDPPLEGFMDARFSNLQLISELVPELAQLEGEAAAGAEIGGTLGSPVLTGHFEWTDGAAQITLAGVRLEDIDVYASFVAGMLSFEATGRAGEGSFTADGRFNLGTAAIDGRATLKGENLLLVDLPELRVSASPNLRLHYLDNSLRISGEVDIPRALISGLGGAATVRVSPDEVIIYPGAANETDALAVTSRIRVSVGPDVQVQAAGLRGRIEGRILTVTEPKALPWGQGELRVVDGTFGVFGQRLEIETGRLIYTGGPLENPGLEIRAVRRVDTITAGALVRGTLQHPEISVYSDPPMSRAEALSYLTLGKSLDQLQSGEQRTVNQAANSLALSGGGLIAQDLGRRIGLDDVAVEAGDDTGSAALVMSKYLGGGLYISYGVGLFDAMNTLRLRFQINPRLSIEATSGEESAADIFYTFERD